MQCSSGTILSKEATLQVLRHCQYMEFTSLAAVNRRLRIAARELFQERVVRLIEPFLIEGGNTNAVKGHGQLTTRLFEIADGEAAGVVGSIVQRLLIFAAKDPQPAPASNMNLLVTRARIAKLIRFLCDDCGYTQLSGLIRRTEYMGLAVSFHQFARRARPYDHGTVHASSQRSACSLGVKSHVADEHPYAEPSPVLRSSLDHFTGRTAGLASGPIPPEVEELFLRTLRFDDVVNYSHVCDKARRTVQFAMALRTTNLLLLFFRPTEISTFWECLTDGHGGITGSGALWILEHSPGWFPRNLNTVVCRQGAQKKFSHLFRGVLFPTSCREALIVDVPLDHGVSTYHTMDDLRTESWISPRMPGAPSCPALLSPSASVGSTTFFSWLSWKEELSDGDSLLIFVTSIKEVGPPNMLFDNMVGSGGRTVHGDVLLMLEDANGVRDTQRRDIAWMKKSFMRVWQSLQEGDAVGLAYRSRF
ncbi:hypothetical protein B0H15DRAFT_944442 [Mycena belliarum]|uniref:Uncharacterized protein n=1 Tax=Mycena belliarum TaxID=1033014 RepID=A0AAD6UEX3_9AGAR|nr:hypothetical protein B0H15DRAFT_944442 [Mycena belliae]